ncbi:MAG: DUF5302 domain-containing protein [Actinomycetota bacterium]|nr:DUF5302 domain-containing protein [Actinomycetota bacterium]
MTAKGSEESADRTESGEDDTKRRFAEALERKKAKAAAGTSHRDGGAKQPRSHGPVENRRQFRRKSG